MAQPIQFRRDTATAWTAVNPILAQGELGLELDTKLYKIGDGSTAWNTLPYNTLSSTVTILTFDGQSSEPTLPAAGDLYMYGRSYAGRMMPKWKGPSGLDTAVQAALFGNGIILYSPGTGTVPTVVGAPVLTHVGTASHPTLTSSSLRESTRRWIVTSAATANSISEDRMPVTSVWRGDADGRGGFFFSCRFGISTTVTNQQCFVGFTGATGATAGTTVPSAQVSCLGAGWDAADTNLQIMVNDATGTCTKVDLGSNFPANNTAAMYDVQFFCSANASSIGYRVKRLDVEYETSGTLSTDLPASTTFLAFHAWMNNGGTAAAVVLELMRIYIETDQ